jgi:hypothetical protein
VLLLAVLRTCCTTDCTSAGFTSAYAATVLDVLYVLTAFSWSAAAVSSLHAAMHVHAAQQCTDLWIVH